ncbi:SDR family oxidoreductase [Hydrogenophaga sp.]|uniref:SDR family oxidoreductase n=1 Tax=Hydrogenophaga sp. TaxID=1904254 RepID=UPI002731B394|nr:SDR family oxidoreductase [Hydrogenophaga sp.]MDP2018474.1 SDR family oxidoreductase [Hydrogenophaga sp.]MDP3166547.1 SDR family oxidoreductase [Hydrogenophaga sp.]MDP3809785.1 SDR family oxidoreductase [Hydrogenophaga sp.]
MDLGIKGKWALVCGASKGLGLGCAQVLAAEGVHVVMVARGARDLEAAAQALQAAVPGVKVLAVAADITTPEGRTAALSVAGGPGTAFDIVVNNAGGPPPGDFRAWDRDVWIKAIDANMLTPIELIKATVDGMAQRGFGRIVNITSGAVKAPIDILGLSNGARSGLTGFVAGVARSPLAAQGVTVNNLLPGAFDTDRLKTTLAGAAEKTGQSVDAIADARRKNIPAKRFGTSEEFGAICAFLCSVHAGYITGQNVLADGGAYPGTF